MQWPRRRSSAGRSLRTSRRAGSTSPTIRPLCITSRRSDSAVTSSSSAETSRTAQPASRSATSWRWMNSMRADVHAARRLRHQQQLGLQLELAADDQLLLVAAGERARRQVPGSADARRSARMISAARRRIAARSSHDAARAGRDRRPVVHAQNRVLGQIEFEQQAAPVAVLGNVRDARARGARARRAARRCRSPSSATVAGDRAPVHQPGERLDQLGLAVAFDAGDADDLAGAHLEGDAVHARAPSAPDREVRARVSTVSPGFAAGLSTRSSTSRPTIRRASSAALVSPVFDAARRRGRRASPSPRPRSPAPRTACG